MLTERPEDLSRSLRSRGGASPATSLGQSWKPSFSTLDSAWLSFTQTTKRGGELALQDDRQRKSAAVPPPHPTPPTNTQAHCSSYILTFLECVSMFLPQGLCSS